MEWESLNRALSERKFGASRQKSMTTLGYTQQSNKKHGDDRDEPVLGESIFGDSQKRW